EVIDRTLGAGRAELDLGVGGAHADHPHAGAPRRAHADQRVLEYETARGLLSEPARSAQVDFGVRLAPADVLGGDEHVEAVPEADPPQAQLARDAHGPAVRRAE